jgi:preprotein translocase subunit SecG
MDWTNALIDVLLFFYVVVCLLMCLIVLMQRSKQEGLGAAFGGGITSELLGTGTSAFLVRATVWLAALFFILSISLARLYSQRALMLEKGSPVQQELLKPVTPPVTNAAPAAAAVVPTSTPMTATPPAPAATNASAPVAPTKPGAK